MLDKKPFFIAISLVTGCLVINNASAVDYGNQRPAAQELTKQEQIVTRNADTTLRDAKSAFIQARHILLEDKHNPKVSVAEIKQLKHLVDQAADNLQHTQEIAGRIKGLNSHV